LASNGDMRKSKIEGIPFSTLLGWRRVKVIIEKNVRQGRFFRPESLSEEPSDGAVVVDVVVVTAAQT
jgi:hypothetical protein